MDLAQQHALQDVFTSVSTPVVFEIHRLAVDNVIDAFSLDREAVYRHLVELPSSAWWGYGPCYRMDVGAVLELIQSRCNFTDEEMALWYAKLHLLLSG